MRYVFSISLSIKTVPDDELMAVGIKLKKEVFESSYERLKDVYFKTSVLKVVRMYSPRDLTDLELWALFCAVVDFQVSVIKWLIPMLSGLYKEIENRNLKFIDLIYNLQLAKEILLTFKWGNKKGFRHRFINLEDLICFLISLKKILAEYDSLRTFIKNLYDEAKDSNVEEPVEYVIKNLAQEIRSHFPRNNNRNNLIPNPYGKSPFKRLNLFLRWLVRPYPDLGVWNFIDKRHLLVSLDNGILRTVSRILNVQLPGGSVWKNVLKVTELFREINPEDPTKYDYVFSRPAIMGYCAKDPSKNKCYLCPLSEICNSANLSIEPKTKPLMSKREEKIFNKFLQIYGGLYGFDYIKTEYSIGNRSIDAVAHDRTCNWYVIEVEEKLNYTAIGQIVTYRRMFIDAKGIRPKAIIICKKAPADLENTCRIDANIEVIQLEKYLE